MYQVLARKYRPRNFNELVGQSHVSRALTNALERGRLHHAYLFTGTRGVGKTTIARILAKCLNCETGVTSTPCEVCATCKAVNEGRFIDLIEIDAASRTKVEDTRELLDNVPYAPTQGRFKVYLIDEVHMLSTHSFNALLKTLEEPPEHVKFLFATTDPQKLPITVISRCLQFTLRPLAVDEITEHLTRILQKEEINADSDAIWQIGESAQGSLRDALSLTDQAIAYGQGEVHHQDVKEMLGLIDRTIIYDLILAIHQNNQARVSQLLLQFRHQALDVSLVLDQLISTLHELALLQYLPDLGLKYSDEINRKILQLSRLISAQDLQLYYQIACKGRADLQLSVTQEQGFEMCILRLLAFRPLAPDEISIDNSGPAVSDSSFSASAEVNTAPRSSEPQVTVLAEKLEPETNFISEELSFAGAEPDTVSKTTADSSKPFEKKPLEPAVPDSNTEESSAANEMLSFNLNSADGLVGFDEAGLDVQPKPVAPSADLLDTKFLEPDTAVISELAVSTQPDIPKDLSQSETAPTISAEDLFVELPVAESFKTGGKSEQISHSFSDEKLSDTKLEKAGISAQQYENSGHLMPQDLLTLAPQQLEHEWTVDKWEYWFRNSELSPAVQELAQHGLMTGTINGLSIFQIPQQYEGMLSQLQHALEQAMKEQWPDTQFQVEYKEIEQITPYIMQTVRKEKAYQRAKELLQQEPAIQSLIHLFDAELQNIQLKT
ncbi:DNA polymerase III subunit gamma/tau [Acinetobacter radioresistens]|jgi:DNA polymerase III subunit gamma/tau|uniref:DNA polymerase III subunit gamma/tau n=1 Tax=Acinetobacter radioresistens TaxID=40216 RepID=UPI0020064FFE|nr:DNA polymerase III subunit gamma/tau [Acinetobacter radioresistens]MCK4087127.1 DNA polymerase III subunit gamma/tau [Acinetobacter radioresistens]